MRPTTIAIVLVATIAASYGVSQHHQHSRASSKTARRLLYYVDPMHPTYKSDKPGIAPDCGMPLEPVFTEHDDHVSPASSSSAVRAASVSVDRLAQRLAGIRLAPVERSSITRTIRVVGRVLPEDTRVYRINSGVDGFVRATYRDSLGTLVRKGQTLATYYAPEFLAAASGFLAANERVPGSVANEGTRSIQNYTDRLRNLGMSDLQIKRIADNHKLPEYIDVVSPSDGLIVARNISSGQHFGRDTEFYEIADLSRVWVVAEVYEGDEPYLRPGGMARITLRDEGRQLPARITESLPQSDAGGSSVKVRLEVDNPVLKLRPQMLVDVEIAVHLPSAIAVPLDAVIDSGTHTRVYVEHGEDLLEPREVETGWRTAEKVEILKGLRAGERVVVAGTFLVDSESRLKTPLPQANR